MGHGSGGGTSTQAPPPQLVPGGALPPGSRIVAGEQLGAGTTGRNANEQSGRKSFEVPAGKGNGVPGGEGAAEGDDIMSLLPNGTGSGAAGDRAALLAQDAAARAMEQERLAKILEEKKKGVTPLSSIFDWYFGTNPIAEICFPLILLFVIGVALITRMIPCLSTVISQHCANFQPKQTLTAMRSI